MIKIFLPLMLILNITCSFGQAMTDSAQLMSYIANADVVWSDDIQTIYFTRSHKLYRVSIVGHIDSISLLRYGNILSFDFRQPLKKLLLADRYYSLITLGSRLNELSVQRLQSTGYYDILWAYYAADGLIWVYDQQSNSILKINEASDIKLKFNFQDPMIRPHTFFDFRSKLVLVDSIAGIQWLDSYANKIATQYIKGIHQAFRIRNYLIVNSHEGWHAIDALTLKQTKLNIEANLEVKSIFEYNNKVWLYSDQSLRRIIEFESVD